MKTRFKSDYSCDELVFTHVRRDIVEKKAPEVAHALDSLPTSVRNTKDAQYVSCDEYNALQKIDPKLVEQYDHLADDLQNSFTHRFRVSLAGGSAAMVAANVGAWIACPPIGAVLTGLTVGVPACVAVYTDPIV